MKVLVTGSRGLVGSALVAGLTGAGHFVVRLVRGEANRDREDVVWDPVSGRVERSRLDGIDAVVHLAGESVAGLWTAGKRRRLYTSRVPATEFLAEALAGLLRKPAVFLSASAAGYYGDTGGAWRSEEHPQGLGFLAQLCAEWEEAASLCARAGIRTVLLRFGMVLSPRGGALRAMLPAFRLGLGGPLGSGRQYMSWISLDDAVRALVFLLENDSLRGPVNMVTPNPVTNREFARALGRALRRPAFLPVPALLLRALPGGMAREMLLSSQRLEPAALTRAGFDFAHPHLEGALAHLLGPRA